MQQVTEFDITISGQPRKVTLTAIPGRRALQLQPRLVSILQPFFGLFQQGDLKNAGAALESICRTVDEKTIDLLFKEFVFNKGSYIIRDPEGRIPLTEKVFDEEFSGDTWAAWTLLYHALDMVYRTFFEGLVAALKKLPTGPDSPSISQSLTGGSGE